MTDATVLADRVVALGVGSYYGLKMSNWYSIPGDSFGASGVIADKFTSDWRVAGALMEKCQERFGYDAWQPHPEHYDLPLPRAIIQACVEALEAK